MKKLAYFIAVIEGEIGEAGTGRLEHVRLMEVRGNRRQHHLDAPRHGNNPGTLTLAQMPQRPARRRLDARVVAMSGEHGQQGWDGPRRHVRLPRRIRVLALAPNDKRSRLDGGRVSFTQGRHHCRHRRRSSDLQKGKAGENDFCFEKRPNMLQELCDGRLGDVCMQHERKCP